MVRGVGELESGIGRGGEGETSQLHNCITAKPHDRKTA